MMISNSIKDVFNKINAACKRCGRRADEIKLVAVSKTLPVVQIEEAYKAGLRVFGESRAQEVRDKTGDLPDDIEWHFIGHLQSNKIKYILPVCRLIHSVDSMRLAESISGYCVNNGITANILLEVNSSGESSKYGIEPQAAKDMYLQIQFLPKINLQGLMTIAPFTDDETEIRESFKKLAELKSEINSATGRDQNIELSMGMSRDFEIAIEEGSTIIRVGTSIFGPRRR
ncbi:MAG: YggS family pyridoxal phosphate-dependent enzyme [Calditrichaceae bacterium]